MVYYLCKKGIKRSLLKEVGVKMKKLVPAYILSFVISFMLFIYEPVMMYSTNMNDFWFNLDIMIIPVLVICFISFVIISGIFTLVYFINKKFSDKLKAYNIFFIVVFIVFLASYIQGNYLIKNLPSLDGSKIKWNNHLVDNIITSIIWAVITVSTIGCIIKFKIENVIKATKYISLTIFVMLFVSAFTTILTTRVYAKRKIVASTTININTASEDKNFFIFLVDQVDARRFEKIVKTDEYKDTFKDFTYYPDTLSMYPYTRNSIPLILSGKPNENKTNFRNYYNDAMDNSKFINKLIEEDYNINIYENESNWTSKKSNVVSNKRLISSKIKLGNFTKQLLRYVSFKYLPYSLKKYSNIEKMDFNGKELTGGKDLFDWTLPEIYDEIQNNDVKIKEQKYFKFIHTEGAHIPFDIDKDLNTTKNGTYNDKMKATLKVINAYLDRLKKYDIYDNSVIIILADHGYNFGKNLGRQNPILYIKGIDEHHEMYTSDKPISHIDLADAYLELLDGKASDELFEDIPDERERRYLSYRYLGEKHLTEYIQTGKAWDLKTLKKTGKKYNR